MTDYWHNKTTQDSLNADFAGTSESGVLNKKGATLPFALQVEVRRELNSHHFFGRGEFDYKRTSTQQDGPAGRFLTTYPSNKVTFETGIRSTFGGSMRSRPWDGWLLSAYGETNLHEPVSDGLTAGVALSCMAVGTKTCPSKLTFASTVPRTNRLLAKTGFRRENEQNWLEAGLFGGAVFRPSEFSVLLDGAPVSSGAAPCSLTALYDAKNQPIKLNSCLQNRFLVPLGTPDNADSISQRLTLASRGASKPEAGVFLNFNIRVPVPKNWVVKDLYFEQRGSLFFKNHRDSVVDARWNEKIMFGPTLTVIPSLPGLSLKPSYSVFFYRNKVAQNDLAGRTFDIKLDYRFDWKSGASWRQVLRYGRPK